MTKAVQAVDDICYVWYYCGSLYTDTSIATLSM